MKSDRFKVERDASLDFVGEAYATLFPNLHRYPATMIPQLGVELLARFDLQEGSLLDPYCGSGSSFAAAINAGFKSLRGNDLNPLAVLISKAKFTRVPKATLLRGFDEIRAAVSSLPKGRIKPSEVPNVTNVDFWFPTDSIPVLARLKGLLDKVEHSGVKNLALLALSETIRDVSYTRKNEFKLYRMPAEKMATFQPDTKKIFLAHLERIEARYVAHYLPRLDGVRIRLVDKAFETGKELVDVVLTSPPYGDSGTTVAYGQFSCLTNEWLGIDDARQVDNRLMGGRRTPHLLSEGVLASQVQQIAEMFPKRALEVSSFYFDLRASITQVAAAVAAGGLAIYIVGNRRVKDVQLQTDQFIAEEFEAAGFKHLITYERALSSKSMPLVNSPSNKAGVVRGTMTQEFIVICQRS